MKHIELMRKWCKKIGIKIFDKLLISLDHVTYGFALETFKKNMFFVWNSFIRIVDKYVRKTWICKQELVFLTYFLFYDLKFFNQTLFFLSCLDPSLMPFSGTVGTDFIICLFFLFFTVNRVCTHLLYTLSYAISYVVLKRATTPSTTCHMTTLLCLWVMDIITITWWHRVKRKGQRSY